jgi:hypothetical protein
MDRKSETRKKIQLGGLMVKAGLEDMHPKEAYILYGMLLDCRKVLESRPDIKEKWAQLGKTLLVE